MMVPMQYRDLISSVEDEFFGKVVEVKATKGDIGIVLLADYMMAFPMIPPGQQNPNHFLRMDDYPAHFLEIFFGFIVKKMRVFNRSIDPKEKLLTMDSNDLRFAKIPAPDLQDAIQKLSLMIGEKALGRKNDLRMKNLFFSVFIFCIKFTSKKTFS